MNLYLLHQVLPSQQENFEIEKYDNPVMIEKRCRRLAHIAIYYSVYYAYS